MTSSQAASPTFAALESLGESASEAGQPSPQRASLSESLDGSTHNGSTHEPPDGGHSELEQLQAALAAAQAQVRAMEAKVSMWEECMRTLVYCVMLSPEMNDIYKQECVDLLQNTLVGVEQEPNLLRLAERRREFYGHTQTSFLSSPDPTQLPSDLGRFDFVVMNGVVEHMLPEERKSVLPAVWDVVKPGGVLFVLETPYRYFPYESHTTGLPGIGYLPDRLAFACARKFSRRGLEHSDREALLRAGIRGSSSREILSCLGSDGGRPVLMEPTPSGGGDRIGLWYQQSSVHRESRLRDISLHAFKALKTLTGIEMVPYLTLAIRKS